MVMHQQKSCAGLGVQKEDLCAPSVAWQGAEMPDTDSEV